MDQCKILKNEKLHMQIEIKNVLDNGLQNSDRFIKIFVLKNNITYNRFAIVINKKFGNAVIRNKAKRQFREIYRSVKNRIDSGHDIIFFIKNNFKEIIFTVKRENLIKLLTSTGLIKK